MDAQVIPRTMEYTVVAVTNANVSPCEFMYRIKSERIINFFRQNEFLYNVRIKNGKDEKEVVKALN